MWIMASFDLLDEYDSRDIFLTQESRDQGVVSFEDNSDYKTVLDPKYSIFLIIKMIKWKEMR